MSGICGNSSLRWFDGCRTQLTTKGAAVQCNESCRCTVVLSDLVTCGFAFISCIKGIDYDRQIYSGTLFMPMNLQKVLSSLTMITQPC